MANITVTPAGTIYLVKTPLESDYKNTFNFASLSAQTTYFDGLTSKLVVASDYTYMKKDGKIRVGLPIDTLINYNYCFYNNAGFTTKRYYCFIDRMEYVNENCTDIYIQTDVFQTWYFDIVWNRCFVEREHVTSDLVGEHTIPENLETGEYISCDLQPTGTTQPTCSYVIAVTVMPLNGYSTSNQTIPSGLYYLATNSLTDVRSITSWFDDQGKADAINSIFLAPSSFFSNFGDYGMTFKDGTTKAVNVAATVTYSLSATDITVTKVNYVGKNYTPRNKKLLCFPYSFLQVSNDNGSIINYYWEEFNRLVIDNTPSTDIKFKLRGCLSPGCSFSAYPINYKNILDNFDESITLGKFPIGGWNSDVYTNWLTSNSVNIATSITSDLGSIALGAAQVYGGRTIGGAGSILNGVTGIASTLGTIYQHSLIPNQARGNTNIGDYSYSYNLTQLYFKRISIKNEYAAIIDSYFDMFGYKVNTVKIPQISSRPYWNYLKTIDCNCDGDIPQEDLATIRKACNSGITFWKLPQYIYDYSKDNRIQST